jgi:hypothetical protein
VWRDSELLGAGLPSADPPTQEKNGEQNDPEFDEALHEWLEIEDVGTHGEVESRVRAASETPRGLLNCLGDEIADTLSEL